MTTVDYSLKTEVLHILERHTGRANAVTSYELCDYVGLPRTRAAQRKIQITIQELRRKDNLPILSSSQYPYGYWMPESWVEVYEFAGSMRSRVIEDCLTRRDVLRGAPAYFESAEKVRLL